MILSPISGGTGGIHSWTLRLQNFLLNDDVSNESLFFCDKGQYFTNLGTGTINRGFFGILNHVIIICRYLYALITFRPNILHINISGGISILSDLFYSHFALIFGIKIVVHVRFGRVPIVFEKRGYEYVLLNSLFRNANAIIAIDDNSFKCLTSNYTNVFYLSNPVYSKAKCLKWDRIKNVILFAGHVRKSKGIEDLLAVAGELGKSIILVCGRIDESYRQILTEKYPVVRERVFFTGDVSNHDLVRVMNFCSCLCLPSYSEGFPNVILEAFACRIPVVAYNVGQIPALIGQDERGHIVKLGDLVGLHEALSLVLDSASVNEKVDAAFNFKSKYEEKIVFNQLFKIWKEI